MRNACAQTLTLDPAPGTRQWWAAFSHFAAVRAWCYHQLGLGAEARKWQGVALDAAAQISNATNQGASA